MNGRRHTQSQVNQVEQRLCVSCGASLQNTGSSKQTWSLESLLPVGMTFGKDLCPACRQRSTDLRIGGFVSARL